MSRFVVTIDANHDFPSLRVRSGPGTQHGVVGSRLMGDIVTSLGSVTNSVTGGSETWVRIANNQWIQERGAGSSHLSGLQRFQIMNMMPATAFATPQRLRVNTGGTALNVRFGPDTAFPLTGRRIPNGTQVIATHSSTPTNTAFSPANPGAWVMIGSREWVWRGSLS